MMISRALPIFMSKVKLNLIDIATKVSVVWEVITKRTFLLGALSFGIPLLVTLVKKKLT